MTNKLFALLVAGAVSIGVIAWLVLRTHATSEPSAAGPERAVDARGSTASQLDGPAVGATTKLSVAPTRADTPSAQPITREAAPAETIVLYGYVRVAEGMSPLTKAPYVAVVDNQGERVEAEASAEGAYSISGLRPGHYRLTAGVMPIAETDAQLDLALAENPKRYDITLFEKPSLLIKIVDHAGQPVATKAWLGAVATRQAPGDWVDETPNSDVYDVGRFMNNGGEGSAMAVGCLGRLDLEVAPPVFVSLLHNQRVIATQRVNVGQLAVVFVVDADSPLLKTAKVRVRFVDQAGQEVPKLMAMLNGGSSMRTAKPDAGTCVWRSLPPGWYRVQVHAIGVEQPSIECRVEPGEDKDLGTITLAPEQWISGTIIEPQKTSESIELSCDRYDPTAAPDASYYRYKSSMSYGTEPDRTFRISARSRDVYLLKYDGRQSSYGVWARIVDTRAGPVENVRIELVPGVPVLVHPSGQDWHAVRYRIADDAGVPYVESQLWGVDPQRILLAPGRYQVEVRVGSAEPTRKTITVGADQVDLPLP